jgi:restriction endonuclease S subunit
MDASMIDTSSWAAFKLCDLFAFFRGRGITTAEIYENQGTIPCIQSGESNNGIIGYMDESFIKDKKHVFIQAPFLSVARSGTSGYVHVQNKNSYIGDSVYALKLKESESVFIYLFLATLLNKERYRYRYGRKVSIEKYINECVKLPIDKKGNPDWNHIENYIDSILDYSKIETKIKKKETPLDIVKLRRFKMDDIFVFFKGKRLIKEDMTPGNTNFVASIDNNNGIREKIDIMPAHQGNCITVNYNGSVGEAFYQNDPFCASDDVNVLYPKNWILNKYIGLFLATVIRFNKYRFGYGRKWTLDKMKETLIALPSSDNNVPDWQFMEKYIKALPYSDKI